jgi:hypothetical protein
MMNGLALGAPSNRIPLCRYKVSTGLLEPAPQPKARAERKAGGKPPAAKKSIRQDGS